MSLIFLCFCLLFLINLVYPSTFIFVCLCLLFLFFLFYILLKIIVYFGFYYVEKSDKEGD